MAMTTDTGGSTEKPGFRFTGWHMLATILLFFGVMFAANGTLIYFALTTFGGTVVESSYKAGRAFPAEIEAARAQESLRWTVALRAERRADGQVTVVLTPKDADGRSLTGLGVEAVLERPVDKRADVPVVFVEREAGVYAGIAEHVEPGNWDVALVLERAGEPVFKSRNRVFFRQ